MKISIYTRIEKNWRGKWTWRCSILPALEVNCYAIGYSLEIGWLFWAVNIEVTNKEKNYDRR